ncbi:MAG: hypothetical protein ABI706_04500 [Ilumatobacteraceae bacterium]
MTTKKQDVALIGAGAAACAVCCAGPMLGFLAAIGLGTAAGVAVFGAAGLVIAVIGVLVVLGRRRRPNRCEPVSDQRVTVSQRR